MSASVATIGRAPAGRQFPPRGVRVAVFDVVGTLVAPRPSVPEAYRAAAARQGVFLDAETIHHRFRDAWREEEQRDAMASPAYATSQDRERARWRSIVDRVFGGGEACDAIFAELWDHFATPASWEPIAAGAGLFDAAVSAGVPIALASNFDERLNGLVTRLDPLSRADHVFTSAEIGWRKPAAEFFRTIERRLGCRPHELVLVGDDATLDLAAGQRAGWWVWGVG